MNIQRRQLIGSAVAGTALSVTPLVKAAVKEEKADLVIVGGWFRRFGRSLCRCP